MLFCVLFILDGGSDNWLSCSRWNHSVRPLKEAVDNVLVASATRWQKIWPGGRKYNINPRIPMYMSDISRMGIFVLA